MRVLGVLLLIFGLLLCLTVIGLPFGILFVIVGLILIGMGGRRKTVINNVVQVSNAIPTSAPAAALGLEGLRSTGYDRVPRPRVEPSLAPPPPRLTAPVVSDIREYEPVYDEELFTDVRTEITQHAKRILAFAQQEGFQVVARPDRIILRGETRELVLLSNFAIEQFGSERGYT